jgi:hypothetical protein
MTAIKGYIAITQNVTSDGNSFYDALYNDSVEMEDVYKLPYFGDNVRSFSNTFGDTFQSGSGIGNGIGSAAMDTMKQIAGGAAEVYGMTDTASIGSAMTKVGQKDFSGAMKDLSNGGNAGSYIETPMFYQYEKNDNDIEVTFTLSNTINQDSFDKNFKLIEKLTRMNRPLRLNSVAVEPPRIYEVRIPGYRFMKWAYCSSFSVNLLGNRRIIQGKIIPEGYQISMSFKSLTIEHAGFLDKT